MDKLHLGFEARGENAHDNGFETIDTETAELGVPEGYRHTDCTILWANSQYQKPNVTITKGRIAVSLGPNVKKIQMRHTSSGGIRYYGTGVHNIPNGEYVLSLWGSTYGRSYIKACVSYD